MKSTKGIFTGKMTVDETTVAEQVGIFISDNEITISDTACGEYPKREFFLYPFSRRMFSSYGDGINITKGIEYRVSGDAIGAYIYHHSFPPESERDNWRIKEFSIYVKYNHPQTTFQISGSTDAGMKNSHDKDDSGYAPVSFDIEFQVPRSEIAALLTDREYFGKFLDEYCSKI